MSTLSPAQWTLRHLTVQDWTIHRAPTNTEPPTRQWYVTHRPTGILAGAAPSAMQAYRMARQLAKLGITADGKLPATYDRMQVVALLGGDPVFVATHGAWICMCDLFNLAWWVEGKPEVL